jgi:hypothetical protein
VLTRRKTAGAVMVFATALLFGGAALAAPASRPPGPQQVRSWPSYWSSVCGAAPAGFDNCHAVQLLAPSQHWSGPRAHATARPSPTNDGSNQTPARPSSGYYPADLQSAYGLSTASGAISAGSGAPTVAIVDAYDDPDAASNLSAYRAAMTGATSAVTGLVDPAVPPLCSSTVTSGCATFTKVNQSGGTSYPRANAGWSEEISLDLDMVSAVCPDCNIVLVEASSASNANLADAVNEAKTFDPAAITNSYGGPESTSETAYNSVYTSGVRTAITVAAGDDGYGVEFPAASPGVTAVGGTSLGFTGSASKPAWSQTVWSGSGSGCSADEPMPAWQEPAAYSNGAICQGRQVTDVSADADPDTGVATYDTYGESGWLVFGGTSVSTQIIGATYAVASAGGTYEPSSQYLYVDSSGGSGTTPGLVPVTSGSNGTCADTYLCNAADSLSSGYNGPAGLGYPYGVGAFMASTGGGGTTTSTSTTTTSSPSTSTTSTTSTTTTSTTSTTTTSTTTTSTTRSTPTMTVTVTAGAVSRSGRDYDVPVTLAADNSSSGAGISGASAVLDVYEGASCSGAIAATGSFATGSNGQVAVTFETPTATTWCLEATVAASGYGQASGEATFST